MGKRGGRKSGRGGGGGGQRRAWRDIERHNEKFEKYYNELGIIPEEEKEAFWDALRRDLPNSFRFTGSKGHALAVQERLKDFYIPHITSIEYEGAHVEPPQPVPWYPDQLAWSMTTPKNVVRRFAPFSQFQKFLVSETEVGNISRQEVVSMIPPLLIDIKPGMTVLDMCAAPGSKSCQLMEMLHAGEEESMRQVADSLNNGTEIPAVGEGLEDYGRCTGLLIANDSDYKRAHMLIHQMKRLNSPNLIVTNHDATMYPSIKLPSSTSTDTKQSQNKYLKFDRILADVPCSGDGTARKNANLWTNWVPGNAMGLHVTQARILVRALQMLKVGGRVVYSTCSMNPIENEAVISSAIERCGGPTNVKIIDCSNELPGLKRAAGLRSWKVCDREGRLWNSWKDVEEHRQKEGIDGLGRLAETMFPPTGENADLPLERCMRVYPHLQDTGGFFITLLEKAAEIKAKPEDSSKVIPKASVAAVVEELDHKRQNGSAAFEKINALDDLVTPNEEAQAEREKNATVAESSHQPPYSATLASADQGSPGKRGAEALEEELPAKRAKVEDGTDALIGDRPVHAPAPSMETEDAEPSSEAAASKPVKLQPPQKRKPGQPYEEAFKYLDPAHPEISAIFKFYGISDKFPRDRFMVRNPEGQPAKTIYYTSSLGRDILTENDGRGIKFVHCGVKMFVKQDVQKEDVCRWRIQAEGLRILESWVGPQRIVTLTTKETFRKLLIEMFPKVDGDGWKQLGEIGERVRDISMGCCVLRVEPSEEENGFRERMVFPLWRSMHSLNLMLPKEERRALLLRLYNDDTPLVNTTQKRMDAADLSTPEIPPEGDETPVVADTEETPADVEMSTESVARTEDDLIKRENVRIGQEEEDQMAKRETWQKVGDEEDKFNTTV
ncbi:tRNA (cytosine-5-)-methyltransferase ncl1 [Paecilomyces lecythidis]